MWARPMASPRRHAASSCTVSEVTAWLVSDTSRNRSVLVVLMIPPSCLVADTDGSISTVWAARSMSDHRSAHTSPRRAPVAAATSSQQARTWSLSRAGGEQRPDLGGGGGHDRGSGHLGSGRVGDGVAGNPPSPHGLGDGAV